MVHSVNSSKTHKILTDVLNNRFQEYNTFTEYTFGYKNRWLSLHYGGNNSHQRENFWSQNWKRERVYGPWHKRETDIRTNTINKSVLSRFWSYFILYKRIFSFLAHNIVFTIVTIYLTYIFWISIKLFVCLVKLFNVCRQRLACGWYRFYFEYEYKK